MFQPLDGPSKQLKIVVNTVTPSEAKTDTNPLTDRQVLTLQPDGNIKVYFAEDGIVPNAATVLANGLDHFKNAKESYEAGEKQKVYLLAVTGTVNVVVVERA